MSRAWDYSMRFNWTRLTQEKLPTLGPHFRPKLDIAIIQLGDIPPVAFHALRRNYGVTVDISGVASKPSFAPADSLKFDR